MAEGSLYLVPTPIGNLADMTFRAVEVLRRVDLILAEDTRTSGVLLKHYGIETPQQSYHVHNEHRKVGEVVMRMQRGEHIALVSDAGTPGISDPGFLLIRGCLEAGIRVEALPGASALLPALLKSGFPCDRFVFEGFLPHKKGRQKRLDLLAQEERAVILYESPHRLQKLLSELEERIGDRRVSVSRELTKKFEETVNGIVEEVKAHFEQKGIKGEFVVVIEPKK